jgi:hypothetical protein
MTLGLDSYQTGRRHNMDCDTFPFFIFGLGAREPNSKIGPKLKNGRMTLGLDSSGFFGAHCTPHFLFWGLAHCTGLTKLPGLAVMHREGGLRGRVKTDEARPLSPLRPKIPPRPMQCGLYRYIFYLRVFQCMCLFRNPAILAVEMLSFWMSDVLAVSVGWNDMYSLWFRWKYGH